MNKKDLDTLKAFRKKYPISVGNEVKPSPPHEKDDEHRVYRGGLMRPRYQPPEHEILEHEILTFLECESGDDEFEKLVKEDAFALMRIINKVKEARKKKNLDDLERYSHLLAIGYINSFIFCDDDRINASKHKEKWAQIAKNLAKGRAAGSKSKTEKKERLHNLIRQELDQLYRQGQGYKMTYEQIADFLIERKISTYAKTTTLKHVKKYAPEIKAQYNTV